MRVYHLFEGGGGEQEPTCREGMNERDLRNHGRWWVISKWLLPAMFCGLGFYLQSVFLHYATYAYVHRMQHLPDHAARINHVDATLKDPLEHALGPAQYVQLPALDAIAALFPALFVLFSFCRSSQTLQVWTKVMVCGGFLFGLKGVLGAMTTVPDAMGWEVCKNTRLQEAGVAWMEQEHSLVEFFTLDFHWVMTYHKPLRYCSDMMYSGHTFCVTLFALGCYESLRIVMEGKSKNCLRGKGRPSLRKYTVLKILALLLVSALSVGEQAVEIYYVMLSRFHYSSDIVVALLLTFLFYTNSAVAMFAKQWELRGLHVFWPSWAWGRTVSHSPSTRSINGIDTNRWQRKDMWISKGDVYIPWCCFPFCCMSGRGHLYSDDGILEIYRQAMLMTNPGETELTNAQMLDLQALIKEMNLVEGVPQAEVMNLFSHETDHLNDLQRLKVRLLEPETPQHTLQSALHQV